MPPENYTQVPSAVEGIAVFAPAPPEEPQPRETVEFKCPQCGATTAYSAEGEGLTCTHCGYFEPAGQTPVGRRAPEYEFTVETMQRAAHGWGEARKELACQSCGAVATIPAEIADAHLRILRFEQGHPAPGSPGYAAAALPGTF